MIITGSSRGIGASASAWLGRAGAAVVLAARSGDRLATVAADVEAAGGAAVAVTADVASLEDCQAIVDRAMERFGRIDALINNAAVIEPVARAGRADPVAWRVPIEVNLIGSFQMLRLALPALRRRAGVVLNLGSGAATKVVPGLSAYAASKGGLAQLTKIVAAEEPRVTALFVQPGSVDTGMQASLRRRSGSVTSEEWAGHYRRMAREGRLSDPRIVGRALAWLALHAPHEWSGREVECADAEIAVPAAERFDDDREVAR